MSCTTLCTVFTSNNLWLIIDEALTDVSSNTALHLFAAWWQQLAFKLCPSYRRKASDSRRRIIGGSRGRGGRGRDCNYVAAAASALLVSWLLDIVVSQVFEEPEHHADRCYRCCRCCCGSAVSPQHPGFWNNMFGCPQLLGRSQRQPSELP